MYYLNHVGYKEGVVIGKDKDILLGIIWTMWDIKNGSETIAGGGAGRYYLNHVGYKDIVFQKKVQRWI